MLRVGAAVGATLAILPGSQNYFYPIFRRGTRLVNTNITRFGQTARYEIIACIGEDWKLLYDKGDYSLVDYNRAGVALMELM